MRAVRTIFRIPCSYVNYSNIAARVVRRALKTDLRADAVKRDESHIKFTPWTNGKPASKLTFRVVAPLFSINDSISDFLIDDK